MMTIRQELLERNGELLQAKMEIESLRQQLAEAQQHNFALAAGQCCVKDGLVGDEYGNQVCELQRKLESKEMAYKGADQMVYVLERQLAEAKQRIKELEAGAIPAAWVDWENAKVVFAQTKSDKESGRFKPLYTIPVTDHAALDEAIKAAKVEGLEEAAKRIDTNLRPHGCGDICQSMADKIRSE